MAIKCNKRSMILQAYSILGNTNRKMSEFQRSLENHKKQLELSVEYNDSLNESKIISVLIF